MVYTGKLMKKIFFRFLLRINKRVLPGYAGKDPATLKKWQLALLGYRWWVMKHALD